MLVTAESEAYMFLSTETFQIVRATLLSRAHAKGCALMSRNSNNHSALGYVASARTSALPFGITSLGSPQAGARLKMRRFTGFDNENTSSVPENRGRRTGRGAAKSGSKMILTALRVSPAFSGGSFWAMIQVLEFADVSGPRVGSERCHRLWRYQPNRLAHARSESIYKMRNQMRKVVGPLSQRWQLDGKYVQAVI